MVLFWLFFVTLPFFLGALMLWILEISFSCHVDWVSKGNLYSSWKFTLNPRKEILAIKFVGKFLQEALVWGENEFWNSLFLLSNFLCVAIVNNNYLTCHGYPVVWNRTTLIRNNYSRWRRTWYLNVKISYFRFLFFPLLLVLENFLTCFIVSIISCGLKFIFFW